jgi:hypothetical protein
MGSHAHGIEIENLDEDAVRTYWENVQQSFQDYHLIESNCSTIVGEAHQLMVCLVNILKSLMAILCLAQGMTKWRELAGCTTKYALPQLPRSAR